MRRARVSGRVPCKARRVPSSSLMGSLCTTSTPSMKPERALLPGSVVEAGRKPECNLCVHWQVDAVLECGGRRDRGCVTVSVGAWIVTSISRHPVCVWPPRAVTHRDTPAHAHAHTSLAVLVLVVLLRIPCSRQDAQVEWCEVRSTGVRSGRVV
eukprot:1528504-Rhodomonas_salina.1